MSHDTSLLLFAFVAIVFLIFLIAKWKLNAFVALVLASLFVGFCSGMNLADIAKSFGEGVGAVLSSVAIVVGLGTILGKLLAESGGAEVVARTLIKTLGPKRLPWTMMVVAFVVGMPVWFTVGLVLLIPIVFTVARETNTPLLTLGIPLVAGLSVAHGLVPPHPGPMVAIELLKADPGKTILYSLIVGLPTAVILWYGGRQVVASELTIGALTQFMLYLGIMAMPVLSDDGTILGVVHLHDLMRAGAA